MAKPPKPDDDRRRALRLLAVAPDGHTGAIMMAHGFSAELLVQLIKDGLVMTHREHVARSGRMLQVVQLRITDEGRKAAR